MILVVSLIQVLGQVEPVRAVVLINGDAFLVDVKQNGDIVKMYTEVEDYFTSSESHNSIVSRLSGSQPKEVATPIVFYEKEEEPVVSFTAENADPIAIGNQHYLGFTPGRALLLKKAVDQIRNISKAYRAGTISTIAITSYSAGTYRSRSLSRNRANAIRDLLGAFGVNKSIVSTSSVEGDASTKIDFVRLTFGG